MYPNDYQPLNTIVREPQIKHDSLVDGVIVPGLQCLITGLLSGLAAGVIAALSGSNGWRWSAGVFVVTILLSWVWYRQGWQSRLEKMLGVDLNFDGRIGEPQPEPRPEPVRVILDQDQGRHVEFIDLPCPDKLPTFAAGLLAGRQFAQTTWTGSSGIFSRAEFDSLRDTMIERGLATWRNPDAKAQGVILTAAGRAVMKKFISPTLPDGRK